MMELGDALSALPPTAGRGLAIIDVDEVLALFIQGFDRFLRPLGHEFRLSNFALFSNVYPAGGDTPVEGAQAKALFDRFFSHGCGELEPAPGAAAGLGAIAAIADVIILTNAPETARELRGGWLKQHGMDYPMILNSGPKGPAVKALAARTTAPVMFVDDLISNLDSVATEAPRVIRFQMVADPALRALAPGDPARHRRVDDWSSLSRIAVETVFA